MPSLWKHRVRNAFRVFFSDECIKCSIRVYKGSSAAPRALFLRRQHKRCRICGFLSLFQVTTKHIQSWALQTEAEYISSKLFFTSMYASYSIRFSSEERQPSLVPTETGINACWEQMSWNWYPNIHSCMNCPRMYTHREHINSFQNIS